MMLHYSVQQHEDQHNFSDSLKKAKIAYVLIKFDSIYEYNLQSREFYYNKIGCNIEQES